MNDLRKAAEMALEALEWNYGADLENIENCTAWLDKMNATIPALRQALAQPEQEPLGGEWVPCVKLPVVVHVRNQRNGETHISTREGITPVLPDDLIMRGVAGEEYPIGRELFERTYTFDVDAVNMSQECVDETAKGEHEPIGYIDGMHGGYMVFTPINPAAVYLNGTALYLAPPKKEWVGYTKEDRERIVPMLVQSLINHDEKTMAGLLNAILIDIEQQLKEKNGG